MGIALGHVGVVHIWVGNHRFDDFVQIDNDLCEVFRVCIRHQSRTGAGFDFLDPSIRFGDQTGQGAVVVLHTFVDHHLDTGLRQFKRADQGFIVGDTDRGFRLHFCGPVGESKGLVRQKRADVHFDHAALEDVIAATLIEHLRLGGVHHIAEVHVRRHLAFEGHFHRFRDRHGDLTGRQSQRHGAGVSAKRHAFGHAGVAVAAHNHVPIADGDVIENLVNNVGHRVIDALRVTPRHKTKVIHELHQTWGVFLRLHVPNGSGVTARLIGAVNSRRHNGRRHRFEFLHGHEAGGVLRPHNVHTNTHVRPCMQNLAGRRATHVGVEDLFNRSQALALVADLF